MPTIAVQPLVLKDCIVTFGTDDFQKAISSVAFVPKATTISFQGLAPDAKFTDVTSAEWTCQLTYVQDWDTSGSLSRYLFAHEGETVAATFEPKAGGVGFTANVTITPGQIGGQVNVYATTSVTLGSDKPELVEES